MAMVIAIEYAIEAKSWNQRKMEKVRTNARDRTRAPTRLENLIQERVKSLTKPHVPGKRDQCEDGVQYTSNDDTGFQIAC
jgi:hypothetical protein